MRKYFPKTEFGKNILTVVTGTSIAQIIPILIAPILTRIYSPEEFGIFALYISIATIFSAIATGRYDFAMLLPDKDSNAIRLATLSVTIAIFFSFLVLIFTIWMNDIISDLLDTPELKSLLYLLPLSIFLHAFYQVKVSWSTRKKRFKSITVSRVAQHGTMSFIQIGFGVLIFNSAIGLLVGYILGQIAAISTIGSVKFKFNTAERKNIYGLSKRYIKFPKFDIPNALLNISSTQAPNIFLSVFYSTTYAGFFLLTQRVLQGPVSLISFSILDVFKQKASEDYRNNGNSRKIFKKTFLLLFTLSALPSIILFFYVENIFAFVFGENWAIAGTYAKLLIPAMFLRFTASPLSYMFHIAEKQGINLITQIMLFSTILISFSLSKDHLSAVKFISISYSFYYLLHLLISAKLAGFNFKHS